MTRADLDRFLGDWLRGFAEIQERYASNFADRGGTQTMVLEHLTREGNSHLSRLASRPAGWNRGMDEAVMA